MPTLRNIFLISSLTIGALFPTGFARADTSPTLRDPSGGSIVTPRQFSLNMLQSFTLVIDQAHRTDTIEGKVLAKGYRSNWFYRTADGLHLASVTRHPDPWRRVKPATMLRLNAPVKLDMPGFEIHETLRVGVAPKHVNLDITRFRSSTDHAPLTLLTHGDTIELKSCQSGTACQSTVVGAMTMNRAIRIDMSLGVGPRLNLTVNGTQSVIPITEKTAQETLFFESGIGSDNDVYSSYANEDVTMENLSIKL